MKSKNLPNSFGEDERLLYGEAVRGVRQKRLMLRSKSVVWSRQSPTRAHRGAHDANRNASEVRLTSTR